MTVSTDSKRVPRMTIDRRRQRMRKVAQAKVQALAKRTATRQAVIAALMRGARAWKAPKATMLATLADWHATTFLQRVGEALQQFVRDDGKIDTGVRTLLPFQTMKDVFEDIGILEMGDFLSASLDDIHSEFLARGMSFPVYVARMHPEYKD